MLRIALPDSMTADLLASGLAQGPDRAAVEVVRVPEASAVALLAAERADVALVPTLTVLRHTELFDVLPPVAVSSWGYPYARVFLRGDLGRPIQTLAFDPRAQQEVLLARLILKEHYGQTPGFVPLPAPDLAALEAHDAVLLTGPDVPTLTAPGLSFDLGQEWYELSNYPMVWGLFAARHGAGTSEMRRVLRRGVAAAEARRPMWLRSHEMPESLHAFYAEDLRYRLDDLALAGLSELGELLFEQGSLDEVPTVPFATLPDDDDVDEGIEPDPLV